MADFRNRIPNIKALASTLGSDYSHLHHVLKGAIPPSVRLAKRIESATDGLIRWTEFFELPGDLSPVRLEGEHHAVPPVAEALAGQLGEGPGLGRDVEEVHDVAGLVHAEHEVEPHAAHAPSKPEAA